MGNTVFSKNELYVLSIFFTVLTLGMFINMFFGYFEWASCSTDSNCPPAVDFPIDINSADQVVLTALPGVGKAMAAKILEFREREGGFKTRCEIRKVSGIGPRMYDKIKDKIYVLNDATPETDDCESASELTGNGSPKIDINRAEVSHFKGIKGLGPKIGMKIIEYREKNGGRIGAMKELSNVEGIGEKRLKKLNEIFTIY